MMDLNANERQMALNEVIFHVSLFIYCIRYEIRQIFKKFSNF